MGCTRGVALRPSRPQRGHSTAVPAISELRLDTTPLFWALPTTTRANDTQIELRDPDGGEAIAVVWKNPIDVALPVAEYLPALRADAGDDQCVAPGAAIELPARADVPEGGSARWQIDGVAITDTVGVVDGVHMLARVIVRADGFEVRDEAIVRAGEIDVVDAGAGDITTPLDGRCACTRTRRSVDFGAPQGLVRPRNRLHGPPGLN